MSFILRSSLARTVALRGSASATVAASTFQKRAYAKKPKKSDDADADTSRSKDKRAGISTDAFVPGSQQSITDPGAAAEHKRTNEKMAVAVAWFQRETQRAEARASGRITPALLDPVRVVLPDTDGHRAHISELATVGVRDGTVIVVTAFDLNHLKAIQDALYEAKLPGIVPQRVDERTIRIPVPKPTVEARHATYTAAIRQAEETRQQLRRYHQTSVKKGKYTKHSVEFEQFQKLLDRHVAEVDSILASLKKSTGAH